MTRVFVIATTPMQQAGLRAMLTTPDIEIVGESLVPDIAQEELSESDVIVIADEVLLDDAVRTIPREKTVALVVMANNEEKAFTLLRSLKVQSWGILPTTASASYLQGTVVSVAQGSVVFPATLMHSFHEQSLYLQSVQLEFANDILTAREHIAELFLALYWHLVYHDPRPRYMQTYHHSCHPQLGILLVSCGWQE